jgi:hypothetical protein
MIGKKGGGDQVNFENVINLYLANHDGYTYGGTKTGNGYVTHPKAGLKFLTINSISGRKKT